MAKMLNMEGSLLVVLAELRNVTNKNTFFSLTYYNTNPTIYNIKEHNKNGDARAKKPFVVQWLQESIYDVNFIPPKKMWYINLMKENKSVLIDMLEKAYKEHIITREPRFKVLKNHTKTQLIFELNNVIKLEQRKVGEKNELPKK